MPANPGDRPHRHPRTTPVRLVLAVADKLRNLYGRHGPVDWDHVTHDLDRLADESRAAARRSRANLLDIIARNQPHPHHHPHHPHHLHHPAAGGA